mgnify:CR=1 FL=1
MDRRPLEATDLLQVQQSLRPAAPTQVLRLSETEPGRFNVEEVFLDTGERISGSSVAAACCGDRLLVGAVMDSKFLDCRL